MIWVPMSTREQGGALLPLPPGAQCQCHCHYGYSQLLKGVQAPAAMPQESQLESSAHVLYCSWHLPLHLIGDEPQHGQGFQGNLKLHCLRLLLQLLWRDKHSLGIPGPISQELQGGRLLAVHR